MAIFRQPREIPATQIDAFLDEERKASDADVFPKVVRSAPSRRVNIGPRPGVLTEYDMNGVHIKKFVMILGAHEVVVECYVRKNRPAPWQGIEEKVAASVEATR